ncbi:MAG: hypothetical protein ACE5EG_05445, partial [Thermoanaerobaculia bacterium]
MTSRRPVVLLLLIAVLVLSPAAPAAAQKRPQTGETRCPPELREELAKLLAENDDVSVRRDIQEKYRYCAKEGAQLPRSLIARHEYCGRLVYAGSLYFERLRCCGYEPQKRLFNCPVEIRQPLGFGAYPVPGSYEYVLSCVHLDGSWQPAAVDRVHLTNGQTGDPDWYTAVTAKAGGELAELELNGRTLRARSILSWNLTPKGDCDFRPVWGNVIEYKIRLDPTDVPPPAPAGKKVFATSTTYNGNLGSIAGAHAKCQARAGAAGLPGTFKAWISGRTTGFGDQNAADDLSHATVPYELVNGTKVADDWADLTDGTLDHAIDRDEFGNSVSGSVWTNTETNGMAHDITRDCGPGSSTAAVWTSSSGFESGRYGTSTASNSGWTMTN